MSIRTVRSQISTARISDFQFPGINVALDGTTAVIGVYEDDVD